MTSLTLEEIKRLQGIIKFYRSNFRLPITRSGLEVLGEMLQVLDRLDTRLISMMVELERE